MEENQNKTCSKCGLPVVENNGVLAHVGGGVTEQKCKNCGWSGGQYGKFSQCPRCGYMTSLIDDHDAS